MNGINKLFISFATYYRSLEKALPKDREVSIQAAFYNLADFIQELGYFLGQRHLNIEPEYTKMKTNAVGQRLIGR